MATKGLCVRKGARQHFIPKGEGTFQREGPLEEGRGQRHSTGGSASRNEGGPVTEGV